MLAHMFCISRKAVTVVVGWGYPHAGAVHMAAARLGCMSHSALLGRELDIINSAIPHLQCKFPLHSSFEG